jgi:hypothetical protein
MIYTWKKRFGWKWYYIYYINFVIEKIQYFLQNCLCDFTVKLIKDIPHCTDSLWVHNTCASVFVKRWKKWMVPRSTFLPNFSDIFWCLITNSENYTDWISKSLNTRLLKWLNTRLIYYYSIPKLHRKSWEWKYSYCVILWDCNYYDYFRSYLVCHALSILKIYCFM